MPITRRQFLKRTGVATAGVLAAPGLFGNPLVRRAMAETIGNKYLIVLFLDGGNDGLNTVTPAGNALGNLRDAYYDARDSIRLTDSMLSTTGIGDDPNTNTPLALHPGLIGLKNLYDTHNAVAVVQGCGYPDYSLSHEEARIIWQTGTPHVQQPNGWVGRHLMQEYGLFDIPGISISSTVPLEFRQVGTNVLAVNRLSSFRFPYDSRYNSDNPAKAAAFQALHQSAVASGHGLSEIVGSVGDITLQATINFQTLHGNWNTNRAQAIQDAYSDSIESYGGGTATRLREISKLIYGVEQGQPGVDSHFFWLNNGGYDTHSDQGTNGANQQHFSLHREVGDAIEVFYNDMIDLGVEDRVCIVVWSEFSRRIDQNESGTDHGSQGPMFVIGGGVTGGIYGNHPDIRQDSLDGQGNTEYTQSANPADPYVSTDFRDVFGTVLKHWVGMSQGDVAALLPTDGDPDPVHYWNTANFDMGFLP